MDKGIEKNGQPAVIVHPQNKESVLINVDQWDRFEVVDDDGNKIAEINGVSAIPAKGYLIKLYPNN